MTGWNSRKNSSRSSARSMSSSRRSRSRSTSCMRGWKTTNRPLPSRLGVVHRDVGIAQQLLGVVVRLREGHADAGGDMRVAAVEHERLLEGLGDRRRDALHVAAIADALEQDRELVAAEARHRVRRPRALHRGAGRRVCSSRSPASWPRESLTFLKSSRSRNITAICCLRALRQGERVLDAVAEQAAIGEQRQGVVKRELSQLLLQRLALTDVAEIQRQPACRRIVEQVAAHTFEGEAAGTAGDHQLYRSDGPARRGRDLAQKRGEALPVGIRPEVEEIAPDEIVRMPRERALGRRGHEAQAPVDVGDHDHVGGIADQGCVARLDHARPRAARAAARRRGRSRPDAS